MAHGVCPSLRPGSKGQPQVRVRWPTGRAKPSLSGDAALFPATLTLQSAQRGHMRCSRGSGGPERLGSCLRPAPQRPRDEVYQPAPCCRWVDPQQGVSRNSPRLKGNRSYRDGDSTVSPPLGQHFKPKDASGLCWSLLFQDEGVLSLPCWAFDTWGRNSHLSSEGSPAFHPSPLPPLTLQPVPPSASLFLELVDHFAP